MARVAQSGTTRSARPSGQPARPGVSGTALDGVDRWLALGLGLVDILTDFSRDALDTAAGPTERSGQDGYSAADLLGVLPGALAGLSLIVQQRAFDVVSEVEAVLGTQLDRVGAVRLTGDWSGLPAASSARKLAVCEPSARPEKVFGLVQSA